MNVMKNYETALNCLEKLHVNSRHYFYAFLKKIIIKMKLPFFIFCVSKTAFLQLFSKGKQLSKELRVTLEVSNLISGDSTDIFSSSFNSADESELLLQTQGRETKKTDPACKYLFHSFFITEIKF
jgi:hypothetical protein